MRTMKTTFTKKKDDRLILVIQLPSGRFRTARGGVVFQDRRTKRNRTRAQKHKTAIAGW